MTEILGHRDRSLEVTFGGSNQRYIEIPFVSQRAVLRCQYSQKLTVLSNFVLSSAEGEVVQLKLLFHSCQTNMGQSSLT